MTRDELHRLVDELTDGEVHAVLGLLRHRRSRPAAPWPPPWLGGVRGANSQQPTVAEWEASFVAESVAGRPRPPYLPNDLVAALDHAPLVVVEAFLAELEAHAGEDIPAAELWARWRRMTSA